MNRFRRISLSVMVTGSIALAAWWVLYPPYNPEAVLRAIPDNAGLVSIHEDLAGRWGEISKGPVLRTAVACFGVNPEGLDEFSNDAEAMKWFHRLAARRTAFAHVRSLGGVGRDGWVAATWVGTYGPRLRWLAQARLIRGVTRTGSALRRPIWRVQLPSLKPGQALSACVAEGVLMLCLSSDPQGVRYMVDSYDSAGAVRSIVASGRVKDAPGLFESASRDCGWYGTWQRLFFRMPVHGTTGAVGCMWGEYRLPEAAAGMPGRASIAGLGQLLGDIPQAMCLFSSKHAEKVLGESSLGLWVVPVMAAIRKHTAREEKPMFLCVLGGDYRGQISSALPESVRWIATGFPVPTVMIGIEVDSADLAGEGVSELVDRMNAILRLGLVPQSVQAGENTVTALEGTGRNAYGRLGLEERVAYAVCGKWLVFCSNMGALRRVLARYDREEAKADAMSGRWMKSLRGEQAGAQAYAWVDFDKAGQTVEDGLALWRLAISGRDDAAETRGVLKEAEAWAHGLRGMGVAAIGITATGSVARLGFTVEANTNMLRTR